MSRTVPIWPVNVWNQNKQIKISVFLNFPAYRLTNDVSLLSVQPITFRYHRRCQQNQQNKQQGQQAKQFPNFASFLPGDFRTWSILSILPSLLSHFHRFTKTPSFPGCQRSRHLVPGTPLTSNVNIDMILIAKYVLQNIQSGWIQWFNACPNKLLRPWALRKDSLVV